MASDATVKALLSSSNQTYSAGALNKATAATTAALNSTTGTRIIGKIPGYNSNINPANKETMDYTLRLKNNLTTIQFDPMGYEVNLNYEELKSGKTSMYKLSGTKTNAFKIKNEDGSGGTSTTSTYNAVSTWLEMQKKVNINRVCENFKIISTNDSTVNESLSNEFTESKVNNWSSLLGNKGREMVAGVKDIAQTAIGAYASMNSTAMIDALSRKSGASGSENQFLSLLSGQLLGIQTALPKLWSRSDYNNTSSFTIKLVSPSGAEEDIDKYIVEPLLTLILAASPITFDGVSYGFPPLWSIKADGIIDMNLAAITAIVITRGGQDTVFNRYNQPTNIDIRMTVEPLVSGFATPLGSKYLSSYPDKSTGEVGMIVANPERIAEPMRSSRTGNSDKYKRLDPIGLESLRL